MMAATEHVSQTGSYVIRCSAANFEHAAWLSAVFSEVLSVNEQEHSLQIFPLTDSLKGQLEKMGASVSRAPQPL